MYLMVYKRWVTAWPSYSNFCLPESYIHTGDPQLTNGFFKNNAPWKKRLTNRQRTSDRHTTRRVIWSQCQRLATSSHLPLVAASYSHVVAICNIFLLIPGKKQQHLPLGKWIHLMTAWFALKKKHCKHSYKTRSDSSFDGIRQKLQSRLWLEIEGNLGVFMLVPEIFSVSISVSF